MKISVGCALTLICLLSDKKFLMFCFTWKNPSYSFYYEFAY